MYIWSQKVRPIQWTPWADTLCYYEFDNDLTDSSWNGHDLSVRTGSVSYWTDASWWKYAYFNKSTWTYAYNWFPQVEISALTLSYWWKPKQIFTSGNELSLGYTTTGNDILLAFNRSIWIWATITEYSATIDTWYHIVWVIWWWQIKFYINWELIGTTSDSHSWTASTKLVINNAWDTNSSSFANNNYISKLIIETKSWSAQDVADYYDLTKWDYWIS